MSGRQKGACVQLYGSYTRQGSPDQAPRGSALKVGGITVAAQTSKRGRGRVSRQGEAWRIHPGAPRLWYRAAERSDPQRYPHPPGPVKNSRALRSRQKAGTGMSRFLVRGKRKNPFDTNEGVAKHAGWIPLLGGDYYFVKYRTLHTASTLLHLGFVSFTLGWTGNQTALVRIRVKFNRGSCGRPEPACCGFRGRRRSSAGGPP